MKLRILTLVVFVFGLIPRPYSLSAPPAQANSATDWSYISTDVDGDGLPNSVETGGWCNGAGCFTSDPFDIDSDDDGLTDGEEKLFDANPNDSSSPGIYVLYEDAFKTREYYPWQPYAHKMIARADSFIPPRPDEVDETYSNIGPDDGNSYNAVVVRRGTTFYVGGPVDQNLSYSKSIGALDNLKINGVSVAPNTGQAPDPHTDQWAVTVPSTSGGTVGKYTLTLGNNTMDVLVIFELPTPTDSNVAHVNRLTSQGIEKLLYDDNPDVEWDNWSGLLSDTQYPLDTRDATYPYYVSDPGYFLYDRPGELLPDFIAQGAVYRFKNQQYNRFVLEGFDLDGKKRGGVIDAINGKTSQKNAADAVATKVDIDTLFKNPHPRYSTKEVLVIPAPYLQQCSNVSALLTTYSRAAGIPARPMITDWVNNSFDHANEIWVNGQWRVYRGYSGDEAKADGTILSKCGKNGNEPWQCGTNQNSTRANWGENKYRPWWRENATGFGSSNILLTPENWNSYGLAYRWSSYNALVGIQPDVIRLNPNRFDIDATGDYWLDAHGYDTPINQGNPGWPAAPPPPAAPLTLSALSATNQAEAETPSVQIGDVVAEYGVDTNGNGKFDQLVFEVEVTAAQAGLYDLQAQLGATSLETGLTLAESGGVIDETTQQDVPLVAGTQIVNFAFSGTTIALQRADGPYALRNVWVADFDEAAGPTEFQNDSLAVAFNLHTTAAYKAADFETFGALLTHSYSHATLDSNGDGLTDALVVTTGITVDQPGEYTVAGNLYDRNEKLIGRASWSGTGPEVTLQFSDIGGTVGPYTLQELELSNAAQAGIDSIYYAYTIDAIPELVTATAASFEIYGGADAIMAFGAGITPTTNFNTSLQNGDLKLDAEVQVSLSGSYKLEAWLADQNGDLITWAVGSATTLQPGVQTLSATFDGANILARGIPGPYKIVGLKVLNGSVPYSVIDEVGELPQQTQAYQLNDFAASPGANVIFEDYAESGPGKWSPGAPWAIENDIHQYITTSNAWSAGDAEAALTIASPLNLAATGYAFVDLKFLTSYNFGSGEAGYVEVSTNGSTWTKVATYTGNASWSQSPQLVDLSAYAGQAALRVRFRLAAPGGSWQIDDVVIVAQGEDSDGDGIPDEEEGTGDEDGDGIPNHQDTDSDGDGIPDADEGTDDPDGDGKPNYLDDDSDGDGIPDKNEGTGDPDGDGKPNYLDDDSDGDGIPDKDEWTNGGLLPHCGNQGGLDTDEDGKPNCRDNDADGDGIPNYLDNDSDGDGKPDKNEGTGDSDGDSIPDYLDSEDEKQNFGVILQSVYLPIVTK